MPQNKLFVRRGDKVLVLSGKDRGKKGKVISTVPATGRVKVEGINIIKKHAKPTKRVPQGGIREMEAEFAASRVMVICPACSKPSRLGKKEMPDGRRVRICKKCGEPLDK